jgi:hypothetical protein
VPAAVVACVDRAFVQGKSQHLVQGEHSGRIRYRTDPADVAYRGFRSWQGLAVTRELTKKLIADMTRRLAPEAAVAQDEYLFCA